MSSLPISLVRQYFIELQSSIVTTLEKAGGATFLVDSWERAGGNGGGISKLIEGAQLLERAGVLFSHIQGQELPNSANANRPELSGRPWEALGVSLVLHPRNPYVPTVHMNVRLFVASARANKDEQDIFWFGGGTDLTPYYAFEEDAHHFHQVCHDALAPHGPDYYPRYKRWCDEYFFLKHRQETRGIGGIFFDNLNEPNFTASFALVQSVGDAFLKAYLPILERRYQHTYGERERDFQAYRRGRYVEFNLVFDRGTLFGLQSNGRTESILLSMPPAAHWRYNWQPQPDTPEGKLAQFLVPREWV